MTQQDRTTNKARFEQGDTPQGSDYVDLIDSYLSLSDTTAQSVSSPVTVVGAVGASTTVSAASIEASAATITGTVSAATGNFDILLVQGEEVRPPSQQVATGELHLTATAAATTSAAGAFSILPGAFSSLSVFNVRMSASPTLAEIEYLGTATATFFGIAFFSMDASASNKLGAYRLAVNASSLSRTEIRRWISSTTDVGAASVGGSLQLKTNDRASFMVSNLTDTVGMGFSTLVFNIEEKG